MYLLANSPGIVFSKEQIYSHIWKVQGELGGNSVSDHISSLRQKLGLQPKDNEYIQTVFKVVYRFAASSYHIVLHPEETGRFLNFRAKFVECSRAIPEKSQNFDTVCSKRGRIVIKTDSQDYVLDRPGLLRGISCVSGISPAADILCRYS